ncbi:MAG: RNA chaperone Hfq [Pseudoflavonifractor capillosus]|uniref:RNA chaperone Hfq n=1 Tax=Pseudoflavonifractor capillosus TaxID=106588 RepID=UPI0023F84E69|nr:RNA chaperone Hfq [Pseudoflavonifractor capillosus]MCI5929017.1 RNA chaperone Hfq [Pseudoflavonifractor capillosus]MDY4660651.1 RNA chaperone Hfq [Pseudoflavonifractor capillosus]
MQKTNNLQDLFLTRLNRTRANVTFFLMNGYQLRGQVAGFDAFVVFLITDGKQQMIYKHAISTITPERPVDMSQSVSV